MALTQIAVENLTRIPIYSLLTWAGEHIFWVYIQAPSPGEDGMYDREDFKSGSIPYEYVWYDLKAFDQVGGPFLHKNEPEAALRGSLNPPGKEDINFVNADTRRVI